MHRPLTTLLLTMTAALAGPAVRVIDGDTLVIEREVIRLLGVDTPETARARCAAERARGEQARRALADLVVDRPLTVDRRGFDRYGRTLAVVSVDDRDLAAALIAAGHGVPYWGGRHVDWCG